MEYEDGDERETFNTEVKVASRRELVAATEYKRMLSEAALVDEQIENIVRLVEKMLERYETIDESLEVLASLGYDESAAGLLAYNFGLVPHLPGPESVVRDLLVKLRPIRDVLPEIV